MNFTPEKPETKKLYKQAAFVGALLALLCQLLPPDHRALCTAVAKLASVTCGG